MGPSGYSQRTLDAVPPSFRQGSGENLPALSVGPPDFRDGWLGKGDQRRMPEDKGEVQHSPGDEAAGFAWTRPRGTSRERERGGASACLQDS